MYYIGSLPVNDAQLQHYGIKGMRWGVIRSPEQLGHPRNSIREGSSKQPKNAKISPNKSKNVKTGFLKTHRNKQDYRKDTMGNVIYNKKDPFGKKVLDTAKYYTNNPLSFVRDALVVSIIAKVIGYSAKAAFSVGSLKRGSSKMTAEILRRNKIRNAKMSTVYETFGQVR